MFSSGILLDDLISELQALRAKHGNVECWVSGGDYPEGAGHPVYRAKSNDGYHQDNTVILQ